MLHEGVYYSGMSINNTHYNLIDTFNHIMGREKFSRLFHEFNTNIVPFCDNDVQKMNRVFTDTQEMPYQVSATFVECFLWIKRDLHNDGGAGYGVDNYK
jgi:hypothetical protein